MLDETSNKETPKEIKGWNWGAFMFNMFWGIGHKSYLPLLCFIPIFNIVWIFVCGFKGNEWAWQNGDYKDAESFLENQKTWNRAGLAAFIFSILGIFLYIIFIAVIIGSSISSYNSYNY